LQRVLRRTPSSSLAEYVAARSLSALEGIDWKGESQPVLTRLRKGIEALPEHERERVFEDFERVEQLCDEPGQRALQSVLAPYPTMLDSVRSCNSHEGRGLLVLIENEGAFDQALATAYADRMRYGRSWSGFTILVPVEPRHDSYRLAALEDEVGDLFKALDGSGRKLKIDFFERPGDNSDGAVRIIHYSIYVEGLPESGFEFELDEPTRRTRRPVIEAAICCDPDKGHVDIVSKGGARMREEIARSFVRCLAGSEAELEPLRRRHFDLDRLKRPIAFPRDQADGINDVRVTLLRLANIADRFGRLTIEIDDAEAGSIYDTSASWFGDADPLKRPNWRVTHAKLRIVFHREAREKRDKAITVELRAPNGSNLKDQTRRHQLVSVKYLERWGLIEKI
jgi:hypothetical protein